MAVKHSILITAAGGHIGSELIPQLLEENVKLVLPTSNAERMRSNLPPTASPNNIAIEEGSISNPNWLQSVMERHSVDSVFLVLTGTDEFITTLNFFDVMKRSKTVKHLVYLSGCGDFQSEEGFRTIVGTHTAAHVIVKSIIERKLAYTPFPWTSTVLGPSLFYINDLRSKHAILQGVFDEPLGEAGVSRVSCADIARVARNALVDQSKWAGKKIMIGSKKRYTGTEIAKLWSDAIGKEVKMVPANEEGFTYFEESFGKIRSNPGWIRDIKLMYEAFAQIGFGMTEEDYALQVECLGREPESYEEFVQKTGRGWTSV